ncbi:fungal alpha-L-arabinofuranosidase [Fusarium globosum]|uniref:Alpha-L-arabinofuranosidase n=1 Tax=Fusarium globosum TaxID=78864 RepID=A0A8H5XNF3_9HYPO|nr:fungal alpha-L-arabinofuranosidase [Fusarium globosum]
MTFRKTSYLLSSLAAAETRALSGPCDIYADGGTPCVAAFGTTRALYGSYNGPLYQLQCGSDGQTTNIVPTSPGGVADVSAQDTFCANTTCAIPIIYDQSGQGNHLTRAPPGGGSKGPAPGQYDDLAAAYGAPAIYFGDDTEWGSGAGSGPWAMADMENGLFSGQGAGYNPGDPTIESRFVTTFLKGNSTNLWALRGGSETAKSLSTYYSGPRPNGYYPMDKQGAIVLGIGGDNGNLDQGTWYEGVLTSGYPSDETEDAVQANIEQAGFTATSLANGPPLKGSTITIKATTPGFTNRYLAHDGSTVDTQVITSSSDTSTKQKGSWIVRQGLVTSALGCVSLESVDTPGSFIRHSGFQLYVNANDGSKQFSEDATWCPQQSFDSTGSNALRSWSYPTRYFRHYDNTGYAAMDGGWEVFDASTDFTDDASWVARGLKIVCYTVRGIIHRQYSNKEAETTLLVLIFRFHSDGRDQRIKWAKIDITFFVRSDQSGNDPEVALVYPDGSLALYPTKRTETACNRGALTATTGLVAASEVGAEQPREKIS